MELLQDVNPIAGFCGGALLLSFTISPRSLAKDGQKIKELLITGDLEMARRKISWIVGRDTKELSATEVTRATVETIAENIVDGIFTNALCRAGRNSFSLLI